MTILAVAVLAILAVWAALAFNRLVRLRNQTRTAWADIDVQLQRRHDLVPQLVTVVQGYAAHERATLEAVTELRAQAQAAHGAARQGAAEASLEQALGRLIALREAYPDRVITKRAVPDWLIKLIARFGGPARQIINDIGNEKIFDGSQGEALLGRPYIGARQSIRHGGKRPEAGHGEVAPVSRPPRPLPPSLRRPRR